MEKIKKLEEGLTAFQGLYHMRKGREQQWKEELKKVEEEIKKVAEDQDTLQEIRLLLQEASSYAREQARQQIEYMVTQALQYIFGQDMEFKIEVGEVRNRPEAEFLVTSTYSDGMRITTRPQDARGGGVVDVISLALRIALLQCYRPVIKGPIILDEPAKHVSDDYSANVASFLKQVSNSFGRQVILVTHNGQLAHSGDKVFSVELKSSKSEVKQIL